MRRRSARARASHGLRRAAALIAAILLIASLAGCGGSSQKKGELTWFMWSGSQEEVAAWKHVAQLVTEKYPDIHIKFMTTSFGDYFTKLITLAASDSLPCLLSVQAQRAPGVGSLFEPLDTRFRSGPVRRSDFDSTIMKALSYEGKSIALPYDIGPYLIYYNKKAFAAAGLTTPRPGWTMADFTTAAKKLTRHGMHGFAVTGYPDHWLPFAITRGAHYLKDGDLDLDNDKLVGSLDWVSALVHTQHVAPDVPSTPDQNWDVEQYQAGNAAMVIDGPWDLINAKQSVDFGVGLAPMPTVDGHSETLLAGSGFGIAKSCHDKESAWKALSVMTGPKAEQYLGTQGRAFPARPAQQHFWYSNAVPGAKAALAAALRTAEPYATTAKWDQTSMLLFQNGVNVLNGSQSARSVLENVQSQLGD